MRGVFWCRSVSWNIKYCIAHIIRGMQDKKVVACSVLLLRLLYHSLPYVKHNTSCRVNRGDEELHPKVSYVLLSREF